MGKNEQLITSDGGYAGLFPGLVNDFQMIQERFSQDAIPLRDLARVLADEYEVPKVSVQRSQVDRLVDVFITQGIVSTSHEETGRNKITVDHLGAQVFTVAFFAFRRNGYGKVDPEQIAQDAIGLVVTHEDLKAPFEAFLVRKRREKMHVVRLRSRRRSA